MKNLTILLVLFLQPLSAHELSESDKFNAVINQYTEATKRLDPFWAATFGVEEDLDKFGDFPSPEYYARSKKIIQTAIDGLSTIHPERLAEKDRLAFRLFKDDVATSIHDFDFPSELLQFNQMDNRLQVYMADSNPILTAFPFDSVAHYEKFIKRSEGFPTYVDRQIDLFRRGIKEKITLSCGIIEKTVNSYKEGLEPNVEKNPFWRPTTKWPAKFSEKDRVHLSAEFRQMITERIVPGFKKFDTFFKTEYAPHCRTEFGIGKLPNGKAWYAHFIRSLTDTNLDPDTIHAIGLKEVSRVEQELLEVQKQLGYKGSRQTFRHALLNDPRFFFKSAADEIAKFESVKAAVAARVPNYFSLKPKTDFKVVEADNPEAAAGEYQAPTDMMPIGRFVANTKHLRMVAEYDVTSLLMHETVPGHHMQLALQYEMKDQLSEYQRKIFSSNAFTEGWALYSEYLGREMGLYKDPMQKLGNLSAELLRAVRLVVDTGIHSQGWSHDKTVKYMRDHLISEGSEIEIEANRYSVWPAQALAYKIGQLKILELRHLAEKELGASFNIKEFHKVVIGHGTLSLSALEDEVHAWIASQRLRQI